MNKKQYREAELLNDRLSEQSYATGWNNEAAYLLKEISDDCWMCGRCRKCRKGDKPYRELFLLAFTDAKKVMDGQMTADEWLSKFGRMRYDTNDKCRTYDARRKKEEIEFLEEDIIKGGYDHLSDEEFGRIIMDMANREYE